MSELSDLQWVIDDLYIRKDKIFETEAGKKEWYDTIAELEIMRKKLLNKQKSRQVRSLKKNVLI
jgi:hypothetical protein